MKKVMFAMMIVAGSLASVVSFGQDGKGGDPSIRAQKISDKLKTELSLTDTQYTEVYNIDLKYGTKMHDLKKADGTRESKMTEFKALNKGKNDELKTVFSDAQWSKYREWQKTKRHEMKRRSKDVKNG